MLNCLTIKRLAYLKRQNFQLSFSAITQRLPLVTSGFQQYSVVCIADICQQMFSRLKGVKPQLILHAAMRLQNQECSPRGTTFTSPHKNDLFILSTLPLSVSSRVLEAVTTPRLVLITVFHVSFSSWSLLLWFKHL